MSMNLHMYVLCEDVVIQVWLYTFIIGCILLLKSVIYLDILENFVLPQFEELQQHVFFQQGDTSPYWGTIIHSSLSGHFI